MYIFLKLDITNFPSKLTCLLDKAQLRYSRWGVHLWFFIIFPGKLVTTISYWRHEGLQGGIPSFALHSLQLFPHPAPFQMPSCLLSWDTLSGAWPLNGQLCPDSSCSWRVNLPQSVLSFSHEVWGKTFLHLIVCVCWALPGHCLKETKDIECHSESLVTCMSNGSEAEGSHGEIPSVDACSKRKPVFDSSASSMIFVVLQKSNLKLNLFL